MYVRCSSSRCYDGRRLSEQRQKFANILMRFFYSLLLFFVCLFFVWFLVVVGFCFFVAFMGLLSAISTTLSISKLNLQNERL